MNIEQAKTIPIVKILERMGCVPVKTKGSKLNYPSPFRKEKEPSFWVDQKTNRWWDYGDIKWQSGDAVDLVRAYLDSQGLRCDVPDALRWFTILMTAPVVYSIFDATDTVSDSALVLKSIGPIKHRGLILYGQERGIPETVLRGCRELKEACVLNKNTDKTFYAFGFENESKGYELRNPLMKACIRKKDITFIRGTDMRRIGIMVFEGFFDYLSIITQREGKPLEEDALILNSLSCLRPGDAYLKGYGYKTCQSWFDNDEAGQTALSLWDQFCNDESIRHFPQNTRYAFCKDVNDAHMKKLELI